MRASVDVDVVKNAVGFDEFCIAKQGKWRLHYAEEKEEEEATMVRNFQEIKVQHWFIATHVLVSH